MTPGYRGTILLALVSAGMWGLWWVPIRQLEAGGLDGVWPTLLMALGALPAMALAARAGWRVHPVAIAGAVLAGFAVTLYGSALAFTDVVRAVLLFYLAPAWSTAIECLFLGRRWTARSALALALSFAGVATIFRFEVSGGAWNAGDLAALVSGMAWSAGAAMVFTRPEARFGPLSIFCGLGALASAALVLTVAGEAAGAAPTAEALAAVPAALGAGAIYLAPILLITMYAAQRLPPATMSFLLTAEILAGVASSAVFLDERFGAPEAIGAVLVALGALVETSAPPLRRTA